jgi:hypothetical protein
MRFNCVGSEVSASLCALDQQWMDDEFDRWREEARRIEVQRKRLMDVN